MKKLYEEFIKFNIEESLIRENDTVLAALSGGTDSVCLLLLLNELKEQMHFSLSAMYIDHMIRGGDSVNDGVFSKKLCDKLGIPFYTVSKDVPSFAKEKGLSLEEAARILRYEALWEKAKELSDDTLLAVAHNLQDQCETLLFRMARGTGPKGMAGMKPKDKNLIRPILFADKGSILDYLAAKEQSYCTDATNDEICYSRNRVRKNIIPELLDLNPGALEHIGKLASQMDELMMEVENRAFEYANANSVSTMAGFLLKTEGLHESTEVFRTSVVREFIRLSGQSLKDITSMHYEAITNLIKAETGKSLDLPGGVRISKTYEGLLLKGSKGTQPKSSVAGEIKTCLIPYEEGMGLPTKSYTKWFDYDKIKGTVQLRTREKGDYIVIHPDGSKKKLKEWFINEKIPRELRDDLPLVASDDEVLWVIGHRTGEGARITSSTKTILQIEYFQGGNDERED